MASFIGTSCKNNRISFVMYVFVYLFVCLFVCFICCSPGRFGACFYPPARPNTSSGSTASPPVVYTVRPGLRLWTANMEGKVSATLMYKGLLNESPPGIRLIAPTQPATLDLPSNTAGQFGPLSIYHGQFVVTWDTSRLWVLDTSPCALVGFHGNFSGIVDVCTVGHEIYVLQLGGEWFIRRISLVPKLPNPLLDVTTLLVSSFKDDEVNGDVNDVTAVHTEDQPQEDIPTGLKIQVQSEVRTFDHSQGFFKIWF